MKLTLMFASRADNIVFFPDLLSDEAQRAHFPESEEQNQCADNEENLIDLSGFLSLYVRYRDYVAYKVALATDSPVPQFVPGWTPSLRQLKQALASDLNPKIEQELLALQAQIDWARKEISKRRRAEAALKRGRKKIDIISFTARMRTYLKLCEAHFAQGQDFDHVRQEVELLMEYEVFDVDPLHDHENVEFLANHMDFREFESLYRRYKSLCYEADYDYMQFISI